MTAYESLKQQLIVEPNTWLVTDVAGFIQANLPSATPINPGALDQDYNVAVGDRTSLNQLYFQIRDNWASRLSHLKEAQPIYCNFRAEDDRYSLVDINKGKSLIGYCPSHRIVYGLKEAMDWYVEFLVENDI